MNRRFGFFDVDSRELAQAGELVFRPRVEPLADRLDLIYSYAARTGAPLVFTTCCSGSMLLPDSRDDILYVPLDVAEKDWRRRLADYRLFYLQKNAYGDPALNTRCRAHDTFADNANAVELIKGLDVGRWIVFGNGLDLCVASAVTGILAAGQNVTVLTDVFIPSYLGEDVPDTTERSQNVFAGLAAAGAELSTLEAFMETVSDD